MNAKFQRGHGDMGMSLILTLASAAGCILGAGFIALGVWMIWKGARALLGA